jgi:hypothetical protein
MDDVKQRFTQIIEALTTENDQVKRLLTTQQNQIIHLSEKATSLVVEPLERKYPLVKTEWIDRGIKSVSLEEMVRVTGISKRKIQHAAIRKAGRNGELYLVSSVMEWLNSLPMNATANGNGNGFHQDTDPLALPYMSVIADE